MAATKNKRTASGAPAATTPAAPEAAEQPKPGVLLKSYRLSLTAVEKTSVGVGGTAISSLRLIGLPKRATTTLRGGQAKALRGVTQWSDDVGTKAAHGIGASKRLAKDGAKQGAKAWARGMKFFITLR